MQTDSKIQYKRYYQLMFAAVQNGDRAEADKYRELMEQLRQSVIASRALNFDLEKLPKFAKMTLNKTQRDLNTNEASNCINAAFNFHSPQPTFTPFTTMDFLTAIRTQYTQLGTKGELAFGDVVVFWSRTNDDWKGRAIQVQDIIPEDPRFPFGLVFDHIAIYVGTESLYHKPDPAMSSCYQINHWDDVVGFSEVVSGFELTYHRKL